MPLAWSPPPVPVSTPVTREEVRRAAHTLKSNAATFGAHALAGRSRELEDAAKRGALEGASEQVDAMGSELDLVLEALPPSGGSCRPSRSLRDPARAELILGDA